jgi:hypothetical protein
VPGGTWDGTYDGFIMILDGNLSVVACKKTSDSSLVNIFSSIWPYKDGKVIATHGRGMMIVAEDLSAIEKNILVDNQIQALAYDAGTDKLTFQAEMATGGSMFPTLSYRFITHREIEKFSDLSARIQDETGTAYLDLSALPTMETVVPTVSTPGSVATGSDSTSDSTLTIQSTTSPSCTAVKTIS